MVCEHGRVSDDAAICVARDVCPPFPGAGVWVAGTDVLGLQTLEFVLDSQFVGLAAAVSVAHSGRGHGFNDRLTMAR